MGSAPFPARTLSVPVFPEATGIQPCWGRPFDKIPLPLDAPEVVLQSPILQLDLMGSPMNVLIPPKIPSFQKEMKSFGGTFFSLLFKFWMKFFSICLPGKKQKISPAAATFEGDKVQTARLPTEEFSHAWSPFFSRSLYVPCHCWRQSAPTSRRRPATSATWWAMRVRAASCMP